MQTKSYRLRTLSSAEAICVFDCRLRSTRDSTISRKQERSPAATVSHRLWRNATCPSLSVTRARGTISRPRNSHLVLLTGSGYLVLNDTSRTQSGSRGDSCWHKIWVSSCMTAQSGRRLAADKAESGRCLSVVCHVSDVAGSYRRRNRALVSLSALRSI